MKTRIAIALLALVLATAAPAAETPPRPGIGDYLCHVFQGWPVCKPHPGRRP